MGNDQSAANAAGGSSGGTYKQGFGRMKTENVILNVYEPTDPKTGLKVQQMPGFGIYHTGLEIYGTEYAFGGSPDAPKDYSGIQPQSPRQAPPGTPWKYSQSITIGETELTQSELRSVISDIEREYKAVTYDLMQKNCNHFTADLSKRITRGGKTIPAWVNRAASVGSMFKGGQGGGQGEKQSQEESPAPKPSIFETSKGYRLSESPSGSSGATSPQPAKSGGSSPAVARTASYDIPAMLRDCSSDAIRVNDKEPALAVQLVLPNGEKNTAVAEWQQHCLATLSARAVPAGVR